MVGQIGNTIAVAKRDGVCVTLSPASQYEDAEHTDLLSADDWESHLRVDVVSTVGYEGFAISTDGLRYKSVRLPGKECVAVFKTAAVSNCRHAGQLLYQWDGREFAGVYEKVD